MVPLQVKWVYGCAGLMVVLWRIELSNTKPELSQGERAQYWDSCVAALAFVYCYTYEAYGVTLQFYVVSVGLSLIAVCMSRAVSRLATRHSP